MPYPLVGVLLGFVLAFVWLAFLFLVDIYRELRNPTVVTCPATGLNAAVQLNPVGNRLMPVTGCSRWPAHRSCNQACVELIPLAGASARWPEP